MKTSWPESGPEPGKETEPTKPKPQGRQKGTDVEAKTPLKTTGETGIGSDDEKKNDEIWSGSDDEKT